MNLKFKLTKETKVEFGITFHRIEATKDFNDVKKGDRGGWVANETNIDSSGNAWVYGNAQVSGNAWVSGNAQVYGNAQVSGDAQVYGNAQVYGDAWVSLPVFVLQGSVHQISDCGNGNLKIGCEMHPIEKWISDYKIIGKKHGYTDKQIAEYGEHIKYASKFMIKTK